ncbi:prohead core scaffolding protein and protease [uncultured Caudovirales phage]|uniref:Prohead core scaffolding protein and protease n=1 Tax=uncultured Caudovirales phage TaxID=2100421 RepID=A0A6J5KMT6_9CAUD|nr:prohead core scaffolding protein and protease [uncultured Caudovirales phage]
MKNHEKYCHFNWLFCRLLNISGKYVPEDKMKSTSLLIEHLTYEKAAAEVLTETDASGQNKHMYMKGIFIEGSLRNQNGRVYPTHEIRKAVDQIKEQIRKNNSVLGECDHPQELQIHLDRVSHKITDMWMDGNNGMGKLQILPTPLGNIIKTLLESGVKLGVSSRGSGNVDDSGQVSDFDMLTVDVVANPSAPNAYPKPVYEQLMNRRHGYRTLDLAESIKHDPRAQKHLHKALLTWIDDLKL